MSNSQRFERNLGFLNNEEQDILENSTVSIAGVGGDGALLAVQLARMGVGSFRLADPDPFEVENINRQAVCSDSTIGVNKAVAVGDYIRSINPNAEISLYEDGITKRNVSEFVKGSDLLIDETEFTLHALAVMLAREAREESIPMLTALNIGFGAVVTTYNPTGRAFEKQLGFDKNTDIEKIEKEEVSLSRWLPYLPNYGDLAVLEKVAKGEKSAPSIAPGVAMAAGVATTQAFLNLVGSSNNRPKPVYAPKAIVVDAMSGVFKTVKYNRTSHYKHALSMAVRNGMKLNPKASY